MWTLYLWKYYDEGNQRLVLKLENMSATQIW